MDIDPNMLRYGCDHCGQEVPSTGIAQRLSDTVVCLECVKWMNWLFGKELKDASNSIASGPIHSEITMGFDYDQGGHG